MSKMSPIESEFATTEDADAHDSWFRAKVETALSSAKPEIAHDVVVSEVLALIETRRRATDRLAR